MAEDSNKSNADATDERIFQAGAKKGAIAPGESNITNEVKSKKGPGAKDFPGGWPYKA